MLGAGIATGYGLEGPWIDSGGAIFSAPIHKGPGAHTVAFFNGHRAFPVGKGGRAMTLNTHPHLVLRSFPFWPRVVCYGLKHYFKLPYLYKHTAYFT